MRVRDALAVLSYDGAAHHRRSRHSDAIVNVNVRLTNVCVIRRVRLTITYRLSRGVRGVVRATGLTNAASDTYIIRQVSETQLITIKLGRHVKVRIRDH